MTKNEAQQKLIGLLRKDAYEATTLVAHYAGELKRLQEHNAALVVSLDEFFYRVRTVVQFDDAEWVCDIGAEILKQLKEGPKLERMAVDGGIAARSISDENKKLRAFANDIMQVWPEGGIEGDDLQEIACRHGMLAPEIRHEPCGEWCNCNCLGDFDSADWQRGVECYRRTALLTGEAG